MSGDDKALLHRGYARSSPYAESRLAPACPAPALSEEMVRAEATPIRHLASARLDAVCLLLALVSLLLVQPSEAVAEPVELTISCGRFAEETQRCRSAAQDWATVTDNRVRVLSTPSILEDRLALYRELLEVGVDRLDVIEIDAVWPGLLAPHLLDLTPYIGGDEAQFMAPLIANDTVGGRLVALPWFLDLGLLYFRQDLLDAAQLGIPGTWPALEAAATRLQDVQRATGEPRFWGFLWPGRQQEALTCAALEWIASWHGGDIVAPSGQVTVDNPWAAYALARASGWMDLISPSSVLADTETDTLKRFAAGNAAFMRHWPYAWQALDAADASLRGRVGVANLPRGGAGGPHAATIGGWQLAVSKHSGHPRLAVDLIRHLTSAEVQRQRALKGGYIPTRPALLEEPDVLAAAPYMAAAADPDMMLVARPSSVTGAWYPEVSSQMQEATFAVLAGRVDAETALATLADGLNLLSQQGTNWSAAAVPKETVSHETELDDGDNR